MNFDFKTHQFYSEIESNLALLPANIIANWLKSENPNVIATVFSFMKAEQSSEILKLLPINIQQNIIVSIAHMGEVDKKTIALLKQEIEILKSQYLKSTRKNLGGLQKATELLQMLPAESREAIIARIGDQNSQLEAEMRFKMLSMEKISQLLKPDLAKVCAACSDDDLSLILNHENPQTVDCVLLCLSKNRRKEVLEGMELRRENRKNKLEEARTRIVNLVLNLRSEAKIIFPWEDDLI